MKNYSLLYRRPKIKPMITDGRNTMIKAVVVLASKGKYLPPNLIIQDRAVDNKMILTIRLTWELIGFHYSLKQANSLAIDNLAIDNFIRDWNKNGDQEL